MKYEEVYLKDYQTVTEAVSNLRDYFTFYNHERLHQALGYQTPAQVYTGSWIRSKRLECKGRMMNKGRKGGPSSKVTKGRKGMSSMHEGLWSGELARVSEEIGTAALPSILLTTHPAEEPRLAMGSTKVGGSPDLPQETQWPEWNGSPLPFVAQINLAEVAPYDLSHLLPATGILAFFFDQDAFFESRSVDQATPWQVCYIPDPRIAQRAGRDFESCSRS